MRHGDIGNGDVEHHDEVDEREREPRKEELKALSFRWSSNKSAWYFHRDGYKKRSKKSLTLDEIRGYYGSEKIEKEDSGKIAVA